MRTTILLPAAREKDAIQVPGIHIARPPLRFHEIPPENSATTQLTVRHQRAG